MSTIVNLALLESLKSADFRDEIDLYIPFLAVTILSIEDVPFSISTLRSELKSKFGFMPPEVVANILIARAKKKKLVRVENHTYFPVTQELRKYVGGYEEKKEELERSIVALTSSFISFSQDKYEISIDNDDASKMLLGFMEKNIIGLIHSSRRSCPPEIKNREHLVANFLTSAHAAQDIRWSMIEKIIKGMVLANYLHFADKRNGNALKRDYSNIDVYLDTPILVALLGLNGRTSKDAISELLDLLSSLKISIYVFDKTLNELEGLFYAWKRDLEAGKYDEFNPKTLELLRLKGFDGPRIDTEIALLEDNLDELGVKVIKRFKLVPKYNCDEGELENDLMKKFSRGERDRSRVTHDVTCISRIYNSRRGEVIPNLNSKFAVFCTTNNSLIRHANNKFSEQVAGGIPLLVSNSWLTTIFWLKSGEAFKDLPTHSLLASAFATLNNSGVIWERFKSRLHEMRERGDVSEEQFERIRFDKNLMNEVYDASVSVGDSFESEHVYDIIGRITKSNENKTTMAIEDARKIEQEKYYQLHSEHKEVKGQLRRVEAHIGMLSRLSAFLLSAVISFIVFFAVVAVPYFSGFFDASIESSIIIIVAVFISLLIQFVGSLVGFDIRLCYRAIKRNTERALRSILLSSGG